MRIAKISSNIYKNKFLLKGLEKISEHGMTFSAGTSFLLSSVVRPLAIYSTPDVDKRNKQYAMSKSICSGLIKLGVVEAVALPIEHAVKNIEKNPRKFLNKDTLKYVSKNPRAYKFVNQIIKLSTGILTAVPKSIMTVALIPIIMSTFFDKNKHNIQVENNTNSTPSFTGQGQNIISKGLSKIINNKKIQEFAIKNQTNDRNISKHITAGTDILLTATTVANVNKSKKIENDRKKVLNYNNIISTVFTLGGGYLVDKLLKNKNAKFIEKFKNINSNDPKLLKYIEGINILRPAVIFAGMYYIVLPIISTFLSEKLNTFDKQINAIR